MSSSYQGIWRTDFDTAYPPTDLTSYISSQNVGGYAGLTSPEENLHKKNFVEEETFGRLFESQLKVQVKATFEIKL